MDHKTRRTIYGIIFAIMLILTLLVSTAHGLEIDNKKYLLSISDVSVQDTHTVIFSLSNLGKKSFDLFNMDRVSVETETQRYESKVDHNLDGQIPLVGILKPYEKIQVSVPLDTTSISCGKYVDVKLYDKDGILVARYVNIPQCSIVQSRIKGLVSIADDSAEYDDGSLKIRWTLFHLSSGKPALQKEFGAGAYDIFAIDPSTCMDLQNGKCQTTILKTWSREGFAFVTLQDNRHNTAATLKLKEDFVTAISVDDGSEISDSEPAPQQSVVILVNTPHPTSATAAAQKDARQSNIIVRFLAWVDSLI